MLGVGIVVPVLPGYARDMGASGVALGVIFSSFALSLAIFNPLMGRWADRSGYKRLLVWGLMIHAPVALLYLAATRPWHLVLIRLMEGTLSAMIQPVAMAWAGSLAPKGREGTYLGVFNAFLFLGFGLGPICGGWLYDGWGLAAPFVAMASVLAVSAVLALVLLPPSPNAAPQKKESANRLGILVSSNLMKGLLLFALIIAVGESGLMVFLPLVTERAGLGATETGLLLTVILVGAGVLQAPFGALARSGREVFLIAAGLLMISALLLCVPWCANFPMFLTGSILGGCGAALANPAATALVVRNEQGAGLGFALGCYNMAFGLGMVCGPVLSGLVMDLTGLNPVFYIISGIYLLGTAVIVYFAKK